jgi:hypothetical protein
MSVLKTLRDTVAPELNHLYTTAPAEPPDAFDCGWHGREHALHAFIVARMFGAVADVRTGDFALLSPYMPPLTSIDRNLEHTWCTVNGVSPVDLALNLAFFGQVPQLRTAITGEGRNGDWEVQYTDDESILDEGFGHTNEIIFIERKVHADTELALVENPSLLLPPAKTDEPDPWTAKYGTDIYAKITLHCYACTTRSAKPVRQRLDREKALDWIAAQYAEPVPQILKVLTAANAA